MSTLLLLCLQFFKTGLFAVGGGLATIPFLYEISDAFGWFSHENILNFIAVSESTPGPIGVNMATYAGYLANGWAGALLATLSLVLPSVIIILIVAKILEKFKNNRFVNVGFTLLRPASAALIASAGFGVVIIVFFNVEKLTFDGLFSGEIAINSINWVQIGLFAGFFAAMRIFKKVHPVVFVLIAAGLGILLGL